MSAYQPESALDIIQNNDWTKVSVETPGYPGAGAKKSYAISCQNQPRKCFPDRKHESSYCTGKPTWSQWQMASAALQWPASLDCYTVIPWWLQGCLSGMRHGLQMARVIACVIGWFKYKQVTMQSQGILCQLQCILGCPQRQLAVPCIALTAGKLPAVRAVQGDCRIV